MGKCYSNVNNEQYEQSLDGEDIRTQTLKEDYSRTQREYSHPQTKERGLRRNQPCGHLDLTSSLQNHEQINFWFFSHSVCDTLL